MRVEQCFSNSSVLRSQCAPESPGILAKMQMQGVCGGAWDSAFPPQPQLMLERSEEEETTFGSRSKDLTEEKGTQTGA